MRCLWRRDRFVLTHGEPHPGNTLVTERGVVLIDWDTALIAPPERDLWIVAGDDPRIADAYAAATGVPVGHAALTCYGVLWDLNEIAGYITLLRRPHVDNADVAESWRNLQRFLQPKRVGLDSASAATGAVGCYGTVHVSRGLRLVEEPRLEEGVQVGAGRFLEDGLEVLGGPGWSSYRWSQRRVASKNTSSPTSSRNACRAAAPRS